MRIEVHPNEAEREAAFRLRHQVFIEEQGVPAELERDAYDATAHHVVLLDDAGVVVATGRVRRVGGDCKIERVAVARDRRGQGLGRRVMAALEARALELGAAQVKLAAQRGAIPFYERLGYEGYGADFIEAGIAHRWMRKGI